MRTGVWWQVGWTSTVMFSVEGMVKVVRPLVDKGAHSKM